jgi:hypothetical protein
MFLECWQIIQLQGAHWAEEKSDQDFETSSLIDNETKDKEQMKWYHKKRGTCISINEIIRCYVYLRNQIVHSEFKRKQKYFIYFLSVECAEL